VREREWRDLERASENERDREKLNEYTIPSVRAPTTGRGTSVENSKRSGGTWTRRRRPVPQKRSTVAGQASIIIIIIIPAQLS